MSEIEAPGVGSEILAGIIGAAITMACILPPVVHIVLGPIGPGIGGFVAGNRVGPGARGKVLIAVITGVAVGGFLATAAGLLYSFATKSELPSLLQDRSIVYAIIGGAATYAMVVSFVGATIAGAMSEKKARAAES